MKREKKITYAAVGENPPFLLSPPFLPRSPFMFKRRLFNYRARSNSSRRVYLVRCCCCRLATKGERRKVPHLSFLPLLYVPPSLAGAEYLSRHGPCTRGHTKQCCSCNVLKERKRVHWWNSFFACRFGWVAVAASIDRTAGFVLSRAHHFVPLSHFKTFSDCSCLRLHEEGRRTFLLQLPFRPRRGRPRLRLFLSPLNATAACIKGNAEEEEKGIEFGVSLACHFSSPCSAVAGGREGDLKGGRRRGGEKFALQRKGADIPRTVLKRQTERRDSTSSLPLRPSLYGRNVIHHRFHAFPIERQFACGGGGGGGCYC